MFIRVPALRCFFASFLSAVFSGGRDRGAARGVSCVARAAARSRFLFAQYFSTALLCAVATASR